MYISLEPSGGSSAAGNTLVSQETPAGALNGVNVTFTLANTPISDASVHVYLNGKREYDYSVAGATITMGFAPEALDTIRVDYGY